MNIQIASMLLIAMSQTGCTFAKPPIKAMHPFEPKMKFIKGGNIVINRKKSPDLKNNKVKVKSFWIAKTETTYKQWENCFKGGGCKKAKHRPNEDYSNEETRTILSTFPVTYVNWYEANEYTRWLSKITGKKYRLPTEAEWLLAAQAGKKTRFPWGETLIGIENCTVCNFNSGGYLDSVASLKPYGGLYDMYGNAAEWSCSLHTDRNKSPSGNENICLTPTTYSSGYIDAKGGSYENHFNSEAYEDFPDDATLDYPVSPSESQAYIGFRVVREE
jgi:formylglycine-generating enzyme required for sulfatase activity